MRKIISCEGRSEFREEPTVPAETWVRAVARTEKRQAPSLPLCLRIAMKAYLNSHARFARLPSPRGGDEIWVYAGSPRVAGPSRKTGDQIDREVHGQRLRTSCFLSSDLLKLQTSPEKGPNRALLKRLRQHGRAERKRMLFSPALTSYPSRARSSGKQDIRQGIPLPGKQIGNSGQEGACLLPLWRVRFPGKENFR